MNFHILTLFPEMVMQGLHTSILKRAVEKEYIYIEAVNIRDYTLDKHGKVDDYTYGGGAGMLMQAQPVYDAYRAVKGRILSEQKNAVRITADCTQELQQQEEGAVAAPPCRVIYVTPQGRTFDQAMALEFAQEENLVFLCGHYEGIDERVLEEIVTDYVSIGDYVLTGGELPAMVMIDAIARLVPGVLHNDESAATESFSDNLLEYPQYSRPEVWRDKKVPEILLSGNHAKIEQWRLEQSIERTKKLRPDLYEKWAQSHEEYFRKKAKTEARERKKAMRQKCSEFSKDTK
ncbi:MAG: tRNA (guanosine(37)-N1)-methyltransferase TrmD [Lachnospiraceae bacterium]|nr:tRNA (guanosine(37)-N1)-methyltransferase TrmD [Lachnospiraceae bacterium]